MENHHCTHYTTFSMIFLIGKKKCVSDFPKKMTARRTPGDLQWFASGGWISATDVGIVKCENKNDN